MKKIVFIMLLVLAGCSSAKKQMEMPLPAAKPYKMDEARLLYGAVTAPITIVEYGDFQCPACAMGYQSIAKVKDKYGDQVRVVYKNVPLHFHPLARPAAEVFEGLLILDKAKAQSFYVSAYEKKGQWANEEAIWADVKALNVSVKDLKAIIAKGEVKKRIQEDLDEHRLLGFRGTPAFLVNGVPLYGAHPAETFQYIIDRQLKGI